jgi:hypothetical protein
VSQLLMMMEEIAESLQRHELRDLEKRHAGVDLQSIIEAVGGFKKAEQGVKIRREAVIEVLPEQSVAGGDCGIPWFHRGSPYKIRASIKDWPCISTSFLPVPS